MNNTLRNFFGTLSDTDFDTLRLRFTQIDCNKGEHLLEFGSVCDHIFYLKKGKLRNYTMHADGTYYTTDFIMPHGFCTNIHSFLYREVSEEAIIADDDTTLLSLSYSDYASLIAENIHIKAAIHEMSMHNVIQRMYEKNALLRLDAKGKYLYLLATRPQIIAHFQLQDIASFLNIKPQSLSRIRKETANVS